MVVVSVIEEGSERMETPLTDGVASLLITIGWFVNIVPLWFNLLCAVKWKLFPGGCRRVLLIYLLCINSVFGRRVHPDLLFTKVNRGKVDLCWPKTLRRTVLNGELGVLRAHLSFYDSASHIPDPWQTFIQGYTARNPLVCVAVGIHWWGHPCRFGTAISDQQYAEPIPRGRASRQKRRGCEVLWCLSSGSQQICCPTWVVRMPRSYWRSIKHNNRQINKTPHPRCIISLHGRYKEIRPYMIMQ